MKLYDLLCDISHVIVGMIVALSSLMHWILPLVGASLFVIYELDESKRINDLAYGDIREFMYGYFVTVVGLLIWRFLYG